LVLIVSWSELIATNALVQDEVVQAVLGMNQKHILPCPRFLVFSTSSLPQSFFHLPTSPFLLTYLTSFCAHSIVKVRESLKQEGRRGRAKIGAKSRRAKVAVRRKCLKQKGKSGRAKAGGQKWEPKVRGQSGSLKASSLPSFCFFGYFLVCFVFFCGGVTTTKVTTTIVVTFFFMFEKKTKMMVMCH
jgi:hypothetical protein